MKRVYPVILTKQKKGFLIEVPDMELLTQGKNLNNAIEMARDIIGLSGITMQDMGESIPEPSEPTAIDITKGTFSEEGEKFLTLVDIDFDLYRRMLDQKMVRRNVTLPSWLNVAAEKAKLNVSKVLQDALKEKLGFDK